MLTSLYQPPVLSRFIEKSAAETGVVDLGLMTTKI